MSRSARILAFVGGPVALAAFLAIIITNAVVTGNVLPQVGPAPGDLTTVASLVVSMAG